MNRTTTLAGVAALAVLSLGHPAPADITNGGFELDANNNNQPDGWANATSGSATFNYITGGTAGDDVHTGTSAITIESATGDTSRWFTTNANLAPVTAGENYFVTLWVKVENATDEDVSVKVDWFDGSSQSGSSNFFSLPGSGNTNGWQQMEYEVTVPAGIDGAKPVVYISDGGDNVQTVGSKATIDDVSITAVPEPGAMSLMALGLSFLFRRQR